MDPCLTRSTLGPLHVLLCFCFYLHELLADNCIIYILDVQPWFSRTGCNYYFLDVYDSCRQRHSYHLHTNCIVSLASFPDPTIQEISTENYPCFITVRFPYMSIYISRYTMQAATLHVSYFFLKIVVRLCVVVRGKMFLFFGYKSMHSMK